MCALSSGMLNVHYAGMRWIALKNWGRISNIAKDRVYDTKCNLFAIKTYEEGMLLKKINSYKSVPHFGIILILTLLIKVLENTQVTIRWKILLQFNSETLKVLWKFFEYKMLNAFKLESISRYSERCKPPVIHHLFTHALFGTLPTKIGRIYRNLPLHLIVIQILQYAKFDKTKRVWKLRPLKISTYKSRLHAIFNAIEIGICEI